MIFPSQVIDFYQQLLLLLSTMYPSGKCPHIARDRAARERAQPRTMLQLSDRLLPLLQRVSGPCGRQKSYRVVHHVGLIFRLCPLRAGDAGRRRTRRCMPTVHDRRVQRMICEMTNKGPGKQATGKRNSDADFQFLTEVS